MAAGFRTLVQRYRVRPGSRLRLRDRDPADLDGIGMAPLGTPDLKQRAQQDLAANRAALARAQGLLWASASHSVLVVLQAMDAGGKDGTIKHVMSGVNPLGCEVHAFQAPTRLELDHNFLWRYWDKVPARGRIGIFNRSYYEEVLVVKVHPELVVAQRLPGSERGRSFWAARYDDINRFERHLVRNGTVIVKIFLHMSKDEQRRRLLARLDNPDKRWKFAAADLAERAHWDAYQRAYEQMLTETSTRWAPWYVIPADHKHVARALVAAILTGTIHGLRVRYPTPSPGEARALAAARRRLLAER